MATTTFTDYNTVIASAWLNDVNAATYNSANAGAPVTAAAVQAQFTALAGKNVIINGDCSISQVNGGSLITPTTGTWPIDMVGWGVSQPGKLQAQQVTNKLNSLGATAALNASVLSSYTPLAGDIFTINRAIEGFNFARFQYGTVNAKAGSLQFKVNASVGGTYSGCLVNATNTRSYPFSYTVAANTDTLIQLPNIPGDTGGTWVGATNAASVSVVFDMGSGSTFKGSAGSWQAGTLLGVTGTTNLVSQVNGSTLTITDVQFEVGSVCTQFERKLYGQNLMECQRYLPCWSGTFASSGTAYTSSTTSVICTIPFQVPTMVAPTGLFRNVVGYYQYSNGSNSYVATALAISGGNSSTTSGVIQLTTSGIASSNLPGVFGCNNSGGVLYFTGSQI